MKRFPDDKELHRITMQEIQKKSRDNARTPMQVRIFVTCRSLALSLVLAIDWNSQLSD
jgi:hypothetical protein